MARRGTYPSRWGYGTGETGGAARVARAARAARTAKIHAAGGYAGKIVVLNTPYQELRTRQAYVPTLESGTFGSVTGGIRRDVPTEAATIRRTIAPGMGMITTGMGKPRMPFTAQRMMPAGGGPSIGAVVGVGTLAYIAWKVLL